MDDTIKRIRAMHGAAGLASRGGEGSLGSYGSFGSYGSLGYNSSGSAVNMSALTRIADVPVKCSPNVSILDAAKMMSGRRAHCIIVTDAGGKMVGLATAKDMAFRVVAQDLDPLSPITAIMTRNPYCVAASTSANDALRLMVTSKIRHLPLLDEQGLVSGLLNITKCFYHAMIRLEKMSAGARRLQCTFEDLNGLEESRYSVIGRQEVAPEASERPVLDTMISANEELFDLTIQRRKMSIAKDLKRLINILRQPELRNLLGDSELHIGDFATLEPTASIFEAAKVLQQRNETAGLICKARPEGQPIQSTDVIGIITTKDILFRVLASNFDAKVVKVARVMTPRPNFAEESLGIHKALRLMYEGKYLNLPLVNADGEVTGLVNVLHLTNALLKALDLTNVESTSFPYDTGHDTSSETNSVDEGPAWNKFWGSLDEPLKSVSSPPQPGLSRRSSHNRSRTNLSSEWRSVTSTTSLSAQPHLSLNPQPKRRFRPSISSSLASSAFNQRSISFGETGSVAVAEAQTTATDSKMIKFKLKVHDTLDANLDGKIYRVRVTVDNHNADRDLLSIIRDKIFRKLDLSSRDDCLFDLGYIDDDEDLVALEKNEDLETALESNLQRLVLVLTIKDKLQMESSSILSRTSTGQSSAITLPNLAPSLVVVSSVICGVFLLSRLWVKN